MRRPRSYLFLLALLSVQVLSAPELSAQRVNSIGVELPEDAAPPERQRLRFFEMDGTYMEWFKTIYKRSPATNLISEPLVRQDHNYDLVPAAARSWEATPDGNTWLFHLRSGMQWDDGRPFNAHDYVFTFRRGADPDNAYDFEWHYRIIKNWSAVVGRRLPVDSLGVEAIDDTTLAVHTEQPVPYLPFNLIMSWASPEHAVAKYGEEWSTPGGDPYFVRSVQGYGMAQERDHHPGRQPDVPGVHAASARPGDHPGVLPVGRAAHALGLYGRRGGHDSPERAGGPGKGQERPGSQPRTAFPWSTSSRST